MKRLTKILFVAGGSLLLTGGAVANYLAAQPQTLQEELTLANLEAMAINPNDKDVGPIVQGPAHTERHECRACKTKHVNCEGRRNGGDCAAIHCLL